MAEDVREIGEGTLDVLWRLQDALIGMSVLDEQYAPTLKAYTELYEKYEKVTADIVKANNDTSKLEYDIKNKEKELELKEKEIGLKSRELDIRTTEIESREKTEKAATRKDKIFAWGKLVLEGLTLALGVTKVVLMAVEHEKDKQYNEEEIITNPEVKDQGKRMWNELTK